MTAPVALGVAVETDVGYYELGLRLSIATCADPAWAKWAQGLLDSDTRLEEAEEALMHIKQGDLCVDGLRPGMYGHGMEFARRYFARREGEKGENRG